MGRGAVRLLFAGTAVAVCWGSNGRLLSAQTGKGAIVIQNLPRLTRPDFVPAREGSASIIQDANSCTPVAYTLVQQVRVENTSSGSASGNIQVRLIRGGAVVNTWTVPAPQAHPDATLGSFTRHEMTACPAPGTASMTVHEPNLRIQVDVQNAVAEGNESNNSLDLYIPPEALFASTP